MFIMYKQEANRANWIVRQHWKANLQISWRFVALGGPQNVCPGYGLPQMPYILLEEHGVNKEGLWNTGREIWYN